MIPPHSTCAGTIQDGMHALGVDVAVGELPPLVPNRWAESMRCPHGITLYFAPTSDQIAAWVRDGAR